jgi:hypothetical protein
MSFSQIIQNAINDTLTKYIEKVSSKYKISKEELMKLWNSNDIVVEKENIKSYDDSKQKIVNGLSKLTKPELIELCKSKSLKITGTKAELIENLSNEELKKLSFKSSENIKSKLVAKIPSIAIKRNKFQNFEHEETSFVFDKDKKVYGKQNSDGSIDTLSKEDINLCNKYKFLYIIPNNLDTKSNKSDNELEDIDDLENDVEENIIEDDEEEEDELEEVEEEFEEEYDE